MTKEKAKKSVAEIIAELDAKKKAVIAKAKADEKANSKKAIIDAGKLAKEFITGDKIAVDGATDVFVAELIAIFGARK